MKKMLVSQVSRERVTHNISDHYELSKNTLAASGATAILVGSAVFVRCVKCSALLRTGDARSGSAKAHTRAGTKGHYCLNLFGNHNVADSQVTNLGYPCLLLPA